MAPAAAAAYRWLRRVFRQGREGTSGREAIMPSPRTTAETAHAATPERPDGPGGGGDSQLLQRCLSESALSGQMAPAAAAARQRLQR
eukprot:15380731-Alexandrium_andersonii.AAC.1